MADFAHAMYEHKIRLAFCIPSTCSNKDVQRLFEQVWPAQLPPVQVSSCQTTHDAKADNSGRSNLLSHWVSLPVENYELLLFLLYATLVCLVVCGSALDVYIQHQRKAAQSAHAHLQQQFSLNCYPPMAASLWRPTAHRSLDDNSYRMSSNPLAGQMTSTRQTTSAGNLNVSVGAGFKYITAANFDCSLPNDASNKLRFDWPPLESSVKSSTTSNAVHNRPPSRHSLDASSRRRQFQCNASKQRSFVGLPQPPVEPVLMTIRLFAFIPLSVEGKFVQTLLAFSLPTNFKSLLEIQSDCRNASKNQVSGADPVGVSCTRQNSEQIACLHGFRVISMTWIILTHTYLLPIKSTLAYSRRFLNVSESAWFQVIINGWVLVDSFFFVSALLLTSNQMRLLFRTNGRINLIRLIIGRLFRLAPTAWFLLSVMFLLPVVAPRGPLWDDYIGEQLRHCQTSWWANLIFINNWLPYEQLCMLHTWYLSADLQLFLGSLLFLLPMYSRPLLGAALLVVTTISSAVATFVYTYRNQLAPTVVFSTPNEMDVLRQTQRVYTITLAHVGPYCVGMLTGLALHHWPKIKLSWFVRNTLTMASICTALFILLFTQHWNLGDEWTPMTAAIYASTHRIGWSMCLAWIVYACASGNCDWINTILSCNLFEPFAKLSFCIYLVHYPLLWLRLSYARTPLPFGHYTMVSVSS